MASLRVTQEHALRALDRIDHATFRKALEDGHWNVDNNGHVKAQSVCWLFCWAKSGMGSKRAAKAARLAFDEILDVSYLEFDSHINYDLAKKVRYSNHDIESELALDR